MQALRNFRELVRDLGKPSPAIDEDNLPNLSGKVYVVTGASSGIGFETARLLVRGGAKVWLIGRTPSRLEKSLDALRAEFPSAKVEGLLANYTDLSTIQPAIAKLLATETALHGVVHNAGKNWGGSEPTSIGLEDILVSNVLGGFLVQRLLDDLLIKTAKTAPPNSVRIVWVASSAHYFSPENGGINWDDLNDVPNGRLGFGIYGQTKAFNIYQAILWPKYHKDSGVVSVSMHPGIIISDIRRDTPDRKGPMEMLCRPTIYGAYAEIGPLLSPRITTADNGTYYLPMESPSRIRPDVEEAAKGPRGDKAWKWFMEQTQPFISGPGDS